eukprot:scaffold589571_cov13-Prasinocladus_malaysianus.AAC.1
MKSLRWYKFSYHLRFFTRTSTNASSGPVSPVLPRGPCIWLLAPPACQPDVHGRLDVIRAK